MSSGQEPKPDERGLSARYLAVVFLMGVAACGVFFSLGFLVGYNERPGRGLPAAEQVAPSPAIPPPVSAAGEKVDRPGEAISAPAYETASATTAQKPAAEPIEQPDKEPAATVQERTAAPPPPVSAAAQGDEVTPAFTVQVAATREHADAERLVKELRARGYAVFLVTPEYLHASDNLFRVQVGPFATREEAEKVRGKLGQEGFKPFIRR